jgi:hypothetical protein
MRGLTTPFSGRVPRPPYTGGFLQVPPFRSASAEGRR